MYPVIGQQSFSLFFLLTEMKINPIKLRSSSRLDKFTSSMIGLNKKKAFFFLKGKSQKLKLLEKIPVFNVFLRSLIFWNNLYLLTLVSYSLNERDKLLEGMWLRAVKSRQGVEKDKRKRCEWGREKKKKKGGRAKEEILFFEKPAP